MMNLCDDFKELRKEIENLEESTDVVPIIFLIGKEKKQDES